MEKAKKLLELFGYEAKIDGDRLVLQDGSVITETPKGLMWSFGATQIHMTRNGRGSVFVV